MNSKGKIKLEHNNGGKAMGMCPLCNGFDATQQTCTQCGSFLEEVGKVTDYLDDYSAYMDIDILKLVDGDNNSLETQECLHLFTCPVCQKDTVVTVKE